MLLADFGDYTSVSGVGIFFLPRGNATSMTECITLGINPDLIVEDPETFRFFIDEDEDQEDGAVSVGEPDSAIVTILDEEEG